MSSLRTTSAAAAAQAVELMDDLIDERRRAWLELQRPETGLDSGELQERVEAAREKYGAVQKEADALRQQLRLAEGDVERARQDQEHQVASARGRLRKSAPPRLHALIEALQRALQATMDRRIQTRTVVRHDAAGQPLIGAGGLPVRDTISNAAELNERAAVLRECLQQAESCFTADPDKLDDRMRAVADRAGLDLEDLED